MNREAELLAMMQTVTDMQARLQAMLAAAQTEASGPAAAEDEGAPRVNRAKLRIEWRGKVCAMDRAPLMLATFERLVHRAGSYVSRESLLASGWGTGTIRSDSAVSTCISRLRQRLRDAGMGELAEAIVSASGTGCYCLRRVWAGTKM